MISLPVGLQQEAKEEGEAVAESGDASPTGPVLDETESSLTFPIPSAGPPPHRTRDAAEIVATCADPWQLPMHDRRAVYDYVTQAARAEAQARIDSLAPRFQQQHRDYKQIQVRPWEARTSEFSHTRHNFESRSTAKYRSL